MKNFKNLVIWQKGMLIVQLTYQMTDSFPSSEKYGLASQCQRAAVSIPSNIAEGSSRKSQKDYYRYVEIALGSAFELETQTLVAQMRGYSNQTLISQLLNELNQEQKMVMSFLEKLGG